MVTTKRTIITNLLGFLLIFCATQTHAKQFSAKVDRSRLSINESLTLILSYEGQTMSSPDVSALERDFEIISQQKQSQLAFGLGTNGSSTEWIFGLAPKRGGSLTIPPFSFDGEQTQPIAIKVEKSATKSGATNDIFVETEVDKKTAYVQSQIMVTIRLNTAVMLNGVDISDLEVPNARVLKVHDTQYRKTINGREYIVLELKYALFAENTGSLKIPPLTIAGVVPSSNNPFGGSSIFAPRGKTVRVRSKESSVDILPIPEAAGTTPWIPAKGVGLSQRWSRAPDQLKVGEPITRTITISAQGLTGAQIPPLDEAKHEQYRLYPDQPDITETLAEDGVLGTRSESVALVPRESGTITLPPITITWWDTESDSLQQSSLDAVTLTVFPADISEQARADDTAEENPEDQTPASESISNPNWFYLSLMGNVMLAICLLALLLHRGKPSKVAHNPADSDEHQPDEASAFRNLLSTAEQDTALFRQRILQWGELFWPENHISTLVEIGKICGDDALNQLFTRMDAMLYGNDSSAKPDISEIKAALKRTRKRWRADGKPATGLRPLYPNN